MRLLILLIGLLLPAVAAPAQGPVATKAGLIYFAEGAVLLDGEPLTPGQGQFLFVEEGSKISTGFGRAELLIGISNYVRLGEDTIVQMLSSDLSEVELELHSGRIIIEVGKAFGDTPLTVRCTSSQVQIQRRGLYRLEHAPEMRLKVFDGRAQVQTDAEADLLKAGWMIDLAAHPAGPEPRKFPRKHKDGFDLWSADRSAHLSRMRGRRQDDPTTLGGELQPMYSPQTSPRAKRFPDGGSN
jgi:hypothetical protein